MTGTHPPAGTSAWRALPARTRRRVLRDARTGTPPADPAVARAAQGWALSVRHRSWAPDLVVAAAFAVVAAAVAVVDPRVAGAISAAPLFVLASWAQRRQANGVFRAVAGAGAGAGRERPGAAPRESLGGERC